MIGKNVAVYNDGTYQDITLKNWKGTGGDRDSTNYSPYFHGTHIAGIMAAGKHTYSDAIVFYCRADKILIVNNEEGGASRIF